MPQPSILTTQPQNLHLSCIQSQLTHCHPSFHDLPSLSQILWGGVLEATHQEKQLVLSTYWWNPSPIFHTIFKWENAYRYCTTLERGLPPEGSHMLVGIWLTVSLLALHSWSWKNEVSPFKITPWNSLLARWWAKKLWLTTLNTTSKIKQQQLYQLTLI